jgi:hypothetical protein
MDTVLGIQAIEDELNSKVASTRGTLTLVSDVVGESGLGMSG